jgi:hypothetical protein
MISTELCKDLAQDLQDSLLQFLEDNPTAFVKTSGETGLKKLFEKSVVEDLTFAIENALILSKKKKESLHFVVARVVNSVAAVVHTNSTMKKIFHFTPQQAQKVLEIISEQGVLDVDEETTVEEFFAYEIASTFWNLVNN